MPWITAIMSLVGILIQAGMKAQEEGKAADFATEVSNLAAEWARKAKDDADFDKEFGGETLPPVNPPGPLSL